jgi:hypothetical protein
MGYGHQRATHPLRHMSPEGEIVVANDYQGIPSRDKFIWKNSRKLYETISRIKRVPLIGQKVFDLMDKQQQIPWFYPRRDLSRPSTQVKQYYWAMKYLEWGKHLIDYLNKEPLPLVTSFPVTAFMAEFFGFKKDIYLIVTDTDISRACAALKAQTSRVQYFASNPRAVERLKLYGVRDKMIYMTGFPMAKSLIGGTGLKTIKKDLAQRIYQLDPKRNYIKKYKDTLEYHLGAKCFPCRAPSRPLTITFAVGGAGAQKKLGIDVCRGLKKDIQKGRININLVAGVRNEVLRYFEKGVTSAGLKKEMGKKIKILYDQDKEKYFDKFDKILRTTDILWTKPSELSFYAGLGIPIIMAPPIGSQEFFNRIWLKTMGAGMTQYPPRYANEWLWDWLNSGWLAKAAMEGFLEAPKLGTYNIEEVIRQKHVLKKPKVILRD